MKYQLEEKLELIVAVVLILVFLAGGFLFTYPQLDFDSGKARMQRHYISSLVNKNLTSPVLINEVVAGNSNTIADQEGDFNDWIELVNTSDKEVNLKGYTLSDSPKSIVKWIFPEDLYIKPGEHLLVWCSGKDFNDGKNWHTNFKLKIDGEFLGLYNSQGQMLDSIFFKELTKNVSYGRTPEKDKWVYFQTPTPGTENTGEYEE